MQGEVAEIVLDKNSSDFNCFSFTSKDLIILLFVYNITYFTVCLLVKNDLVICILLAYLMTLVALSVFVTIDIIEKKDELETKQEEYEKQIIKKIKNEYQRIHRLKKKEELLMKAGYIEPEKMQKIITDIEMDFESAKNIIKQVHFAYLSRHGTTRFHSDLSDRQH